jgi:hypothetical protein
LSLIDFKFYSLGEFTEALVTIYKQQGLKRSEKSFLNFFDIFFDKLNASSKGNPDVPVFYYEFYKGTYVGGQYQIMHFVDLPDNPFPCITLHIPTRWRKLLPRKKKRVKLIKQYASALYIALHHEMVHHYQMFKNGSFAFEKCRIPDTRILKTYTAKNSLSDNEDTLAYLEYCLQDIERMAHAREIAVAIITKWKTDDYRSILNYNIEELAARTLYPTLGILLFYFNEVKEQNLTNKLLIKQYKQLQRLIYCYLDLFVSDNNKLEEILGI